MSTSSELLKSSQWITFSYKSCYWACCVSVLVCWARRAARWGDRCPGYAGVLGPDIDISTPLHSTTTVDTSIERTYPLPGLSGWVKHSFSFSPFIGANSQNEAFDRDGVCTLLNLESNYCHGLNQHSFSSYSYISSLKDLSFFTLYYRDEKAWRFCWSYENRFYFFVGSILFP